MTEFHKNRETCSNNFLIFLERTYERIVEYLKCGTADINCLHKFFKELLKNDMAYSKNIAPNRNKTNTQTSGFLNVPNEYHCEINATSSNTGSNTGSNSLYSEKSNIENDRKMYITKEGSELFGKTGEQEHSTGRKPFHVNRQSGSYGNNEETGNVSFIEDKDVKTSKEQTSTSIVKNKNTKAMNETQKKADLVFDAHISNCQLNQNSITDWINYSFMNYYKCANNIKLCCDLLDANIFQKKINLLKETYAKEQENILENLKKKKGDFLKHLDGCKYYWKFFENSYVNSDKYRTDGVRDPKKIKCSWLCQRKYLTSVKYLLSVQYEYLDILNTNIKLFFQLEEWKKNCIRDMLGSYIVLYKSSLSFYLNSLNILYDYVLQEKGIENSHFQNFNSVNISEDVIKPIEDFQYKEDCIHIDKLNNALYIIKNSIPFFNQQINIKSILCLFSSNIKGYLTSVGIFNKYVEGILVVTFDKFCHFFNSFDDPSPLWSYHIDDMDFKLAQCKKKNSKKEETNKLQSNSSGSVVANDDTLVESEKGGEMLSTNVPNVLNFKKEKILSLETDHVEVKERNSLSSSASSTKRRGSGNSEVKEATTGSGKEDGEYDDEENDLEIQMKEKRRTLLIQGWSLAFKCNSLALTKTCFEFLTNHLDSPYFEDFDNFSHCSNIISNGEIKNDLRETHDFTNFCKFHNFDSDKPTRGSNIKKNAINKGLVSDGRKTSTDSTIKKKGINNNGNGDEKIKGTQNIKNYANEDNQLNGKNVEHASTKKKGKPEEEMYIMGTRGGGDKDLKTLEQNKEVDGKEEEEEEEEESEDSEYSEDSEEEGTDDEEEEEEDDDDDEEDDSEEEEDNDSDDLESEEDDGEEEVKKAHEEDVK